MDRIKHQVSELVNVLYGNCQIKWNLLQEEPFGPNLLEFGILPLSMYSFQIGYLINSLVPVFLLILVYPSHIELRV